jgi:hypothetical protein
MGCLHRLGARLSSVGLALGLAGLAFCLAGCSSPAPPSTDNSPLSPARVRAICDAAIEGKPPGNLSLPMGSGDPLPEDGEFSVISEPRGCSCLLVLRGSVIKSKQYKCE